jgi:hypothetical protein
VNEIYGDPDRTTELIDLTDVESVIAALVKEPPPSLSVALVVALGRHGTSHAGRVASTLTGLIRGGSDPDIREAAFLALRGMGEDASSALEAVSGLIDLIDSEVEPGIRVKAIYAVRDQGPDAGSDAVPAITRALDDPSVDVRLAACWVLGSLGIEARESTPSLCRLLKTENPVRHEAARALLQIDPEGRILPEYLDDFSRPVLIHELKRIGEPARTLRHILRAHHTAIGMGGLQNKSGKMAPETRALGGTGVPEEMSSAGALENRADHSKSLPASDVKEFRSQEEIAEYVGISARRIFTLIKAGTLPRKQKDGVYSIPRTRLDALKRSSKTEGLM